MVSSSVKDVAALAHVSIGTVSNVLNRPEIVAPETVERVMAAIEKLSYVRNEAARRLIWAESCRRAHRPQRQQPVLHRGHRRRRGLGRDGGVLRDRRNQ